MIKSNETWLVGTDIHLYGSSPWFKNFDFNPIKFFDSPKSFSLGDLYDITGCSRKNIVKALIERKQFYDGSLKTKNACHGNHELFKHDRYPLTIKCKNILMTHGQIIKWTEKEIKAWYKQRPGRDCITRFISKIYTKYIRPRKKIKVTLEMMKRAINLMDENHCNTIICGHWHPKKPMLFTYKNYRFYILPRGVSLIDVTEVGYGAINKKTGLRDTYYELMGIRGECPLRGELVEK